MQKVFLSIGLLVAANAIASAQTAANAPNGAPKPLLENAQIKVIEMRWKPGVRGEPANRPNSFVYALTDGTLVFVPPGRTPYEMSFRAGEALWLPSQTTALVNEGSKEIRALIVELKEKPPAAAKPRRQPASAAAKKGKPKP
jgi:hypothetical protein